MGSERKADVRRSKRAVKKSSDFREKMKSISIVNLQSWMKI